MREAGAVLRWIATGLMMTGLAGCGEFASGSGGAGRGSGGGSGDTPGETGVSSTSGEAESGAPSAGSDDSTSTAAMGETSSGASMDDTTTGSGTGSGDASSTESGETGGGPAYAGHYIGELSGSCVSPIPIPSFSGTIDTQIDEAGVVSGTASVAGASEGFNGLVSNGAVSGSFHVLDYPCTLSGVVAEDGSGGSGTFSCMVNASCSGTWSIIPG